MMTEEQAPEKFQFTSVKHQYYAVFTANLISLSLGSIIGWLSPVLPILTSKGTPLISGPLTNEEVSWIGSIDCIGALLGTLSFGLFITLMGSKRTLLLLSAPAFIVFWILIFYGNMFYHILIARFIAGFVGGGAQSALVLYVSEISNDDIRGQLSSFMLFFRSVGTLIGYVLGASVEYKIIPCICVSIPIAFLVIFMVIPNTPQYYLHNGQIQKAKDALKFYKGYKGKTKQEDDSINQEFERLQSISNERNEGESLQLADFCSYSALKGLAIGMALMSFTQFTGCFTIITYAVTTFEKVGTLMDPHLSSIMLAVALIAGSLTTTYLADKLGRKILGLISLMGSACGLLFTALYYYLNLIGYDLSALAWVPVVCLSFVIFISSAGIVPIAFICSIEYLPTKIRTYGMTIILATLSIVVFAFVKLYPLLLESIDLHWCFLIFGIGSIMGFAFVLFVLDETNGKCLDDVGKDEKISI